MLDFHVFRFVAFHCKQSNASNCVAFALNFHRSHSSTLRLREFAKRAKKGLMGDCTDSQVPPNPGTRPPSPSLSSASSIFGDDRQLVDEFVSCQSTPLIVNIPSSYYHRYPAQLRNKPTRSKKGLFHQATDSAQCNVWSDEGKIERKSCIQPALVVRSAFGYEEFYRNSEIQSWKKEHPTSSLFDCSVFVTRCLP